MRAGRRARRGASSGITGSPAFLDTERDVSCSWRPPSGAPDLRPADRVLLIDQRRPVPDLEQHADATRHQVAALHPRGIAGSPTQTCSRTGVLRRDVVGAVLEPHEVAGCVARPSVLGGAPEAHLQPAQRHDTPTDAVRGCASAGTTLKRVVGTGLHHKIASLRGIETSSANVGSAGASGRRAANWNDQCVRTARCRTRTSSVSEAGADVDSLPRVVGRCVRCGCRPDRTTGAPCTPRRSHSWSSAIRSSRDGD